jgi:hypothetical protein
MRDRLIREHGTADNQVLWEGQTPLLGDASFVDDAISKVDEWLAVVEADRRAVPLARKIIEAKDDAGVTERCVAVDGADAPLELCDATVDPTIFSSPRIEAGGGGDAPVNGVGPAVVGFSDERLDCETMPIDDFAYAGQSFAEVFTPEQQDGSRAAFSTGVCDYSKPGHGFQAAVPWLTYEDVAGVVIYDGEPMGDPPTSEYFAAAVAAARANSGTRPSTGGSSPVVAGAGALLLAALGTRPAASAGQRKVTRPRTPASSWAGASP